MINTKEELQMIFDEFCHLNPGMANEVVDWYPSGHFEITIKLESGLKMFYNYTTKAVQKIKDDYMDYSNTNYCTEQKFIDAFSWQLFSRIRASGLTNAEVADKAGITPALLSRYITGKTIPTGYTVYKLAAVLGCTPSELLWVK